MEAGREAESLPSVGRVQRVRVALESGARPEGRSAEHSEGIFGLADGSQPHTRPAYLTALSTPSQRTIRNTDTQYAMRSAHHHPLTGTLLTQWV